MISNSEKKMAPSWVGSETFLSPPRDNIAGSGMVSSFTDTRVTFGVSLAVLCEILFAFDKLSGKLFNLHSINTITMNYS